MIIGKIIARIRGRLVGGISAVRCPGRLILVRYDWWFRVDEGGGAEMNCGGVVW